MKFSMAVLLGAQALYRANLKGVENGEFPDGRSELLNFYDIQYIANITLGSPAQDLTVLLDTNFADFWVPSSKCEHSIGSGFACLNHNRYNSDLSITSREDGRNMTLQTSQGTISGFQTLDNLTTPYDGVLGLGRIGLSANGVVPVFERLLSSAAVSEPLIGLSFDRNPLDVSSSGELTWGGVNSEKFEGDFPADFQNFQSISDDYWTLNLNKVTSSDFAFEFCSSGCLGRVSTGSAFITGPRDQVRQINEHLGAVESIDGYWFFFCELVHRMPSLKFFLDGLPFTMDPDLSS
ncbi:Oidioi.mRNA.OKI2018_I69.chr2.g5270.t1.cds [Oikopleura dioica]|uniref:Oidioi.mRNA.OKI2018_I69.chr2.g5270.t1.cds n=1 Tax=Oikopleura dioica TaxID=34765 RepID=A0ABN7T904_OIKDI|nr:Oidioi.mRNA.OKI2018_I69.chr2.g5270.t1.cds [Oikopleura dioica]